MNRLLWIIAILALLSIGFAPVTARAFDIPGTGDGDSGMKKKKKKKAADDSSSDASKTDSSKTDSSSSDAPKSGSSDKKGDNWPEINKSVEPLVEKALQGYNSDDFKALYADFNKETKENVDVYNDNFYKIAYGKYKEPWGNFKSKTLVKERSNPDYFSFGKLSYDVEFDKHSGRIETTFKKFDGVFKLMSLTFQEKDGSAPVVQPGSGVVVQGRDVKTGKTAEVQTYELKMPKSVWDKGTYMKDMNAGDFIETEMPAAPGMKSRTEVVEIGDHTVTFLSRTVMPGAPTTEAKSKQIYSEPDPEVTPVKEANTKKFESKTFDDKIKVGDKGEFAAVRTESYEDGKLVSKMWTCKDVPLGGMVKIEGADGKVMQQVVDFGRGK